MSSICIIASAYMLWLVRFGDMHSNHLPSVTIDFLEESASGLRSASLVSSPIKCLVASRNTLPTSSKQIRLKLDVPGVYLLVGPPAVAVDGARDMRLYIGQADSVADRLDQHLRHEDKQWWRTAIILRQPDESPLDLSQCKFIESELYKLAKKVEDAGLCVLMNRNAPPGAFMLKNKEDDTRDLMRSALIVLSALGLNLFELELAAFPSSEPLVEATPSSFSEVERQLREGQVVSVQPLPFMNPPPEMSQKLRPIIEEIQKMVTGPSFPKSEWYWTAVPDYRAKVVAGNDFRVFLRILLANEWLSITLKDGPKFKLQNLQDLEKHREEIFTAYQKAEKYLER